MKQCTWIRLAKEDIKVKNKRLTHIYRPGSIFRTENLMFLAIAYMFTDPMITLTDMFSAWETMCAGQLRSMTWATGDMRV